MTVAFWLATGQTVVFLALCAWAFWVTRRVAELLNSADIIKAHCEEGANDANRAALRVGQMLEDIHQWLGDVLDWLEHPPERPVTPQQPETEPMKRVSPDTVPQTQAMAESTDDFVAREMAAIMEKVNKPTPAPRTGSTASRKARR